MLTIEIHCLHLQLREKNLSTEILIGAEFLPIERIFEKFMFIQNDNDSGKVMIFGDLE